MTGAQIHAINLHYPWSGSIRNSASSSTWNVRNETKKIYRLYPTGDADATNGRRYVYLPYDMVITDAVKKEYNLML